MNNIDLLALLLLLPLIGIIVRIFSNINRPHQHQMQLIHRFWSKKFSRDFSKVFRYQFLKLTADQGKHAK